MLTTLVLTAVAYCPVTVTRDYVVPGMYQAVLRPAPGCTGPARVRKVSTTSPNSLAQEPGGKDGKWAWNLSEVPQKKLWTLTLWHAEWQWQWWDGKAWQWAVIK